MPWFLPDPVFGWSSYAVLLGFLTAASYTDWRWVKVPKLLTISMLVVGVVFNITRGLWLGAILQGQEQPVWVCPASPLWGALDGFLFALAGFALSFGLFLALWILGMAGGGDVKLLAALGAWVGPYYFFLIFLGTGGVLVLVSLFAVLRKMSRRGVQRTIFGGPVRSTAKTGRQLPVGAQARHRLITYSLPVTLSTAVLFPLFFHADLGWQLPNLSGAPTRFSAQP